MRGRVTKLFPISNTQPLRSSRLPIIPEWGARGTRYANGRRPLCTAGMFGVWRQWKELLTQQSGVITEFLAAGFFELVEEVAYGQFLFFFTLDIQDDLAFHHHDQTISMDDRVQHIMSDHHCSQVIPVYDHFCDLKYLRRCLWVECCGMFVQQKQDRKSVV